MNFGFRYVSVGKKRVSKTIVVNGINYNILEIYNPVQNYYGKIYKALCMIEVKDEGIIENEGGATNTNSEGEWF